jgi:hypothetical protein
MNQKLLANTQTYDDNQFSHNFSHFSSSNNNNNNNNHNNHNHNHNNSFQNQHNTFHDSYSENDDEDDEFVEEPLFSAEVADVSSLLQCLTMLNDPNTVNGTGRRKQNTTTTDVLAEISVLKTGLEVTYDSKTTIFSAKTTIKKELFTSYSINENLRSRDQTRIEKHNSPHKNGNKPNNYGIYVKDDGDDGNGDRMSDHYESDLTRNDNNNNNNNHDENNSPNIPLFEDSITIVIALPHLLRSLSLFQTDRNQDNNGNNNNNNNGQYGSYQSRSPYNDKKSSLRLIYQNHGADLIVKLEMDKYSVDTNLRTFHESQFITNTSGPTMRDQDEQSQDGYGSDFQTRNQTYFENDDTPPPLQPKINNRIKMNGGSSIYGHNNKDDDTTNANRINSAYEEIYTAYRSNRLQNQYHELRIHPSVRNNAFKLDLRCSANYLFDLFGPFVQNLPVRHDYIDLYCLKWDSSRQYNQQPQFEPRVSFRKPTHDESSQIFPENDQISQNSVPNPNTPFYQQPQVVIDGGETSHYPDSLLYMVAQLHNSYTRYCGLPPPRVLFPSESQPHPPRLVRAYRCPDAFQVMYRTDDFRRMLKGLGVVAKSNNQINGMMINGNYPNNGSFEPFQCHIQIDSQDTITIKTNIPFQPAHSTDPNDLKRSFHTVQYSMVAQVGHDGMIDDDGIPLQKFHFPIGDEDGHFGAENNNPNSNEQFIDQNLLSSEQIGILKLLGVGGEINGQSHNNFNQSNQNNQNNQNNNKTATFPIGLDVLRLMKSIESGQEWMKTKKHTQVIVQKDTTKPRAKRNTTENNYSNNKIKPVNDRRSDDNAENNQGNDDFDHFKLKRKVKIEFTKNSNKKSSKNKNPYQDDSSSDDNKSNHHTSTKKRTAVRRGDDDDYDVGSNSDDDNSLYHQMVSGTKSKILKATPQLVPKRSNDVIMSSKPSTKGSIQRTNQFILQHFPTNGNVKPQQWGKTLAREVSQSTTGTSGGGSNSGDGELSEEELI